MTLNELKVYNLILKTCEGLPIYINEQQASEEDLATLFEYLEKRPNLLQHININQNNINIMLRSL